MNINPIIVQEWNSASRLKSAVRFCEHKGISKQETVNGFKALARKYGYSGSVPIKKEPNRRSYAEDWRDLGDGLSFSEQKGLYWKDGVERNEESAVWAGWIGKGAMLRKILGTTTLRSTSSGMSV